MSADNDIEQDNVEAGPDLEPSEGVEIDNSEDHADAAKTTVDGVARRARRILAPLVLTLLLLISALLTTWLCVKGDPPAQQTDAAARKSAVDAAGAGLVAMLTYKPDTYKQDFDAARSHLTGDFLNSYNKLVNDVLTPAARDRKVTTTAQVVGAATSELHPNSAVVMLFVNQATVSQDRPDPAMDALTVLVSLTKVDGKWLINKFQPI
jgi:Mce-associated membrane protein